MGSVALSVQFPGGRKGRILSGNKGEYSKGVTPHGTGQEPTELKPEDLLWEVGVRRVLVGFEAGDLADNEEVAGEPCGKWVDRAADKREKQQGHPATLTYPGTSYII